MIPDGALDCNRILTTDCGQVGTRGGLGLDSGSQRINVAETTRCAPESILYSMPFVTSHLMISRASRMADAIGPFHEASPATTSSRRSKATRFSTRRDPLRMA